MGKIIKKFLNKEYVKRKKLLTFFVLICYILILLLNISSFAAIVSDNDGSAFITKAEFDSLKNDFQSQIDNYNNSIDNKIDAAISSYLAGISIAKKRVLVNKYEPLKNKIKWNSGTSWTRQGSKPKVKEQYNFRHFSTTTAWCKVYNSSNQYTDMFYGTSDSSGVFTVEDDRDMVPRFETNVDYFFGYWGIPSGQYIWARYPALNLVYDSSMCLNSPHGYYPQGYSADNTDTGSGNSWRGIFSQASYSTSPIYYTDYLVAPFSTARTYVYDYGDQVSNVGVTYSSKQTSYIDSGWSSNWEDLRSNTSAQTVAPSSMSFDDSNGVTMVDFNNATIPWIHRTYVMRNLKYKDIITATGKNLPIQYGVCIATVDKDGKIEVEVTAEKNGTAMFHSGNPINNWGTPASHQAGVYYFNCVASTSSKASFDVKTGDDIWFIYYPTDNTVVSKVNFGDLTLEEKQ